MNRIKKAVLFALLALALPALSRAQATLSNTTLSSAVTTPAPGGPPSNGPAQTFVLLTSCTTVARNNVLYVDREEMEVTAVQANNGTCTGLINVIRGWDGTMATPHASGATVYYGAPNYFSKFDPAGACTSTNFINLPMINTVTGRRWNCINSVWMVDNGMVMLPPGACGVGASGNTTGTNGLTVVGASFTGVIQADTSASGTNTQYYSCNLNAIMSGIQSPGKQVAILDATFFYGVQTTALGTQAATLASGTLNSIAVFSKIAYPVAGASETPSTVTPVRADSGTLTLTPVVGSFNTATTTAGAFYSEKAIPASPVIMTTDGTQFFFNVALLCQATSATITNSPGVLVHYAYVPD